MFSPTFDLGTVVILSTISRDGERSPLRSFGSKTAGATAPRRGGRKGPDRDGIGGIESVVRQDDHRPRLAGVVLAASDGPDLVALHSSCQSETESMNA